MTMISVRDKFARKYPEILGEIMNNYGKMATTIIIVKEFHYN